MKELENAILTGRFDKYDFNLPATVILGENGGMYAFLNRITNDEHKEDIEKVITS